MNPIANAALAKARSFAVPTIPTPPKPAPVEQKKIALPGKPARPKNFDQVGFKEGWRDATDFVMTMTDDLKTRRGVQKIIDRLKQAASIRPASQALGVWRVIDLLEAQV